MVYQSRQITTSGGENSSRINRVLLRWPRGTAAVSSWLADQGVYQQLADRYVRTGWLKRLGRGAYRRADDALDWTGGLYALQAQLGLPVHVGARAALELQGYGHFAAWGADRWVSLFLSPGFRLPAWFRAYPWDVRIHATVVRLFDDEAADLGLTRVAFGRRGPESGLSTTTVSQEPASASGYSVNVAAPERAMIEAAYLVPLHQSFEEARLLMEGLATLRPELVQALLEACTSIKAKRVFLYLAEACGHDWLRRVERTHIDLGSGKRRVALDGRYDPTYRITVPKGGIE